MNATALQASTPEAFELRYRREPDPWGFASSPYELDRYDVTLRHLRRCRYRRAFEPGCSIGMLTSRLAERCDEVLATEVSPSALGRARARCTDFNNVRIELRDLREGPPAGSFDLIVFSEVGYYFPQEQLALIARALAKSLDPGGELVAVHWLGTSDDHILHGDEVHAVLAESLPLERVLSARHPGFRVDSWTAT
ncbi:MAG: class I SAM-dependent methyltransferase [Gammaproteobacteria bacterium]